MAVAHYCNAAAAAVNAVVKYAVMNHNWPVTLDYDDYSPADGSVDAVANRKLNLQFVVLAPEYAVVPEIVGPGFQVLPHDLNRHANLVAFHSVAHDSFAKRRRRRNEYFFRAK